MRGVSRGQELRTTLGRAQGKLRHSMFGRLCIRRRLTSYNSSYLGAMFRTDN